MTEKFTENQTIDAIVDWLDYGEETLKKCQQGYFSGGGYAARVLRAHLDELRERVQPEQDK